MTDDRLIDLLRAAVPPVNGGIPPPGTWARVVDRVEAPRRWSWVDAGLAAVILLVLFLFPDGIRLLAFHL